jgi:hypothetical protein
MATISWTNNQGKETLKHIEGCGTTLCGLDIPHRGKEWNVFGEPECKRCIKSQEKTEEQENLRCVEDNED